MRFGVIAAVSAAILTISALSAHAHEGHEGEPEARPTAASTTARGEAVSASFEVVAIARGQELLIYLDRFASNEPVEDAAVEVETPSGPAAAKAEAGGLYRLEAPWLSKPGRFELILTITAADLVDVLPLTLETATPIEGTRARAGTSWFTPAFATDLKDRFSQGDSSLLVMLAVAFSLGVAATLLLRRRRPGVAVIIAGVWLVATFPVLAHEGDDHGPPAASVQRTSDLAQRLPDGSIFVPKPTQRIFALRTVVAVSGTYGRTLELPGRVIADPNASGFVQAAVGGRLSPPTNGFPRLGARVTKGDVLAYVTPPLQAIDVSDMRQRQGELDQQIAIVQRRLARYETLAPSGAIARSVLEETQLELVGLKERRASLDKVRREPEALTAPVSGVIADGTVVAGQMVASNAVIFHIVDPQRLWVEALSFEAVSGTPTATAKSSNGKALALTYEGAGFADRNQSVPIQFSINGDISGLRVGQFVTVLVATDEQKQGLAIPRTSLVRSTNGQDFVYEHVTPERFEPRPVRVEPLDAERVLVATGLLPGKRIVTQGAELLDHVR
jgi:cobalt-zinc-cadmium efflux system membrane fusion protein